MVINLNQLLVSHPVYNRPLLPPSYHWTTSPSYSIYQYHHGHQPQPTVGMHPVYNLPPAAILTTDHFHLSLSIPSVITQLLVSQIVYHIPPTVTYNPIMVYCWKLITTNSYHFHQSPSYIPQTTNSIHGILTTLHSANHSRFPDPTAATCVQVHFMTHLATILFYNNSPSIQTS